jgi:hypothetical protein
MKLCRMAVVQPLEAAIERRSGNFELFLNEVPETAFGWCPRQDSNLRPQD